MCKRLLQKNFVFCNFTINIRPFGHLDFNIYVKHIRGNRLSSPGLSKHLNSTATSEVPASGDVTSGSAIDWAIALFFFKLRVGVRPVGWAKCLKHFVQPGYCVNLYVFSS